jgi:branched-chain amino acid aminotransferase
MNRFRNSCQRISLPDFCPSELTSLISSLVKLDQRWVSSTLGQSLYIRPTAIANNSSLGVRTPDCGKIFVVCSPVGSYYPKGFKPITLMCE